MAQDHSIDTPLRRVTKPEACQILQVSLSTLNRRIAEGQLAVERVQQGQGHRVFVLLPADTDRPEAPEEAEPDGGTELAVAQERIRNLEEMVTLQREWLDLAEARVQQLIQALPAPNPPAAPPERRPWWTWTAGGLRPAPRARDPDGWTRHRGRHGIVIGLD